MNNLNKLTLQLDEPGSTAIQPVVKTQHDSDSAAFCSQCLFNLMTLGLIMAALAIPYYILGNWAPQDSQTAVESSDKVLTGDDAEGSSQILQDSQTAVESLDTVSTELVPESSAGLVPESSTGLVPESSTGLAPESSSDVLQITQTALESSNTVSTGDTLESSDDTLQDSETDDGSSDVVSIDHDLDDGVSNPQDSRTPVESSNIVSIGYDSGTKELTIEFKKGRVYQYSDVPTEVHENLMKADSHGVFFKQEILNAGYEFKQIE